MLEHIFRDLARYSHNMQPKQWLMLLLASIIVGFFCLRGIGSRKNY
jgi:hypothetical protein